MKALLGPLVAFLLGGPVYAGGFDMPCPETLATHQAIRGDPPPGIVVSPGIRTGSSFDPTLGRLQGIGFRTEAADSDAILAPDSTSDLFDTPVGRANRWTFSGTQPVWISCHYSRTYLYVAFPMPAEPLTCYSVLAPTTGESYRAWCEATPSDGRAH